ncbi:MAG: DUF6650 family protein [Pseudomonadota bacterium]|nr:DUF6650 family protein [Pseudomonadota bacterium]
MNFKEIAKRLTGFSSPIFGVSWNPPESETTIAKRIITELEDRRVLYNPSAMEIPAHCVQSVIEIRRLMSNELGSLSDKSTLASSLRAMRAACRKFLDTVNADERIIEYGTQHGHYASWQFNGAIGELRGVFGVHIAQVAVQHGLDIEDDLATILPAIDEDNQT